MRIITLTQGQHACVSDEDYEWLSQWSWHATYDRPSDRWYAARGIYLGGGRTFRRMKTIRMHRLVAERMSGQLLHRQDRIDHIDLDGLNNQRSNVRIATNGQNQQNSKLRGHSTSGFKGVSFKHDHYRAKPWLATIRLDGRLTHIGYFATPGEAAAAYDQAAIKYFGEYARPNTLTQAIVVEHS